MILSTTESISSSLERNVDRPGGLLLLESSSSRSEGGVSLELLSSGLDMVLGGPNVVPSSDMGLRASSFIAKGTGLWWTL